MSGRERWTKPLSDAAKVIRAIKLDLDKKRFFKGLDAEIKEKGRQKGYGKKKGGVVKMRGGGLARGGSASLSGYKVR